MAEQVKLFVILSSITGTHVVERKEKLLQADPHMNSVAHVPQHIYKINKCKNNWEPCSPCSLPLQALSASQASPGPHGLPIPSTTHMGLRSALQDRRSSNHLSSRTPAHS